MNHATWQTGLMVLHRRLDPAWKTERARKALLHAMRDLRGGALQRLNWCCLLQNGERGFLHAIAWTPFPRQIAKWPSFIPTIARVDKITALRNRLHCPMWGNDHSHWIEGRRFAPPTDRVTVRDHQRESAPLSSDSGSCVQHDAGQRGDSAKRSRLYDDDGRRSGHFALKQRRSIPPASQ